MLKIWVGSEGRVLVGEVSTLEEARTIVKFLDHLAKIKALPEMIKFHDENTEIEAHDTESGRIYEYSDQDPSGASDGIWS